MSLAWWDPANWPPCPALFGNIQVTRTIPAVLLFEDFEPYIAGLPLAGQGGWFLVPGSGANPVVGVDGTGLIGGANSAAFSTGGVNTSALGVEFLLPTPLSGLGTGTIQLKTRSNVATNGVDRWADFSNGPTDLVAYSTRAFAVASRYNPVLAESTIRFYDAIDPGGSGEYLSPTGAGVPFTVEIILLGGGAFNWAINGVPSGEPNRQMFAGNELISRYGLGTNGLADDGIVAFDEFTFTGPGTPADIGTSILRNGETSLPLVTGGWNGATIECSQMPGGAFDAAANVTVEHSLDGVHWFPVIVIPGNAAGAEIGTIGVLVTTMIRFTATLPNDVANAGVIIVGVDR
jgi:hypothetical protein